MGKFQFNLNNQDLIAPCGLYCGECSAFQDGSCGGCISRKGLCLKYTKICKIYSCCVDEKGLRLCNECRQFPCPKFKKFFNTKEWYAEVIRNLRRIKKEGIEKFLNKGVRRVKELARCAAEHNVVHCCECPEQPCRKLGREPLGPA